MSHFTVLVIGNNPEEQLAPYDENISVPPADQGIVSEEEQKRFMDYYASKEEKESGKKVKIISTFDKMYAKYGNDWNSNAWRKHTDGTWHEYSTYNPNSKWDWYQLGGRWQGSFKIKPGAKAVAQGEASLLMKDHNYDPNYCDQIYLKDIDFDGMREDVQKESSEQFDKVFTIVKSNGGIPPRFRTLVEKYGKENIDKAREEYGSLPVIIALRKENLNPFFGDICDIYCDFDKEKYLQNKVRNCWIPYAIVKDGIWYERGKMGWWGMASDEKEIDQWAAEAEKLIKDLPPDTLLSMYDCHI